jgi:DNA-binding response OmpR family regulator
MRILIVEDQPEMARLISKRLGKAGFFYDTAATLGEALEALKQFPYELMLLDRRLPDGDGADAVPDIRHLRPQIRIIILTALDAPEARVAGLDAGADDYLAKPFDSEELLARIRARLRQPSGGDSVPPITVGALSFDILAREVFVADDPFPLHKRDFALLEALVRRVDRVVARATLMEEVYGFDDTVLPGALDTLVFRLRKRLSEANAGVEIHLVRGRGYLFTECNS